MKQGLIRLSADIGGTFTDVVVEVDGTLHSAKVLTTYCAPENAIMEGMHQACAKAGVKPDSIGQIIHGTTLATNALIERRGARTAFITTKGFRDVIEMRTESRFEQYDLNLALPEPILPRQHRYVLEERIGASGDVLIPLEYDAVEGLVDELSRVGYESIAVGFLHSYLNDTHEKQVREAIMRKLPDTMVSLSCEVSPQMREYERFNTTVSNAYVKPLMKRYLGRLKERLNDAGLDCNIFLMHSGGGIISIENAAEFPVRLVESGPAGGAVFAANIAARHRLDKVLSFDMGGTTAKICLIKDHTPKTSRVFEVARSYRFKKGSGMPISIPVINMVEIGAGGGSIAHVDPMNQIRVGPESAGAEPGPACYDHGGQRPCVTDADLVLGKLDPDNFAAGSIKLHREYSKTALDNHIGNKLSLDSQTAAFGIAEVVDENMANAARVHAVENGEDLSEYAMIAFGGAAPLHAGRLCQKLGIDRLLVPPGAGVGSALGFLVAPFSFEASRSTYMRLSDFNSNMVRDILADLKKEAIGFVRSCDQHVNILSDFKVYMRYSGQGWEIPVQLSEDQAMNPEADMFQQLFIAEYTKLFGRPVHGMEMESTVWAVNATTPPESVTGIDGQVGGAAAPSVSKRKIFDPALGRLVEAAIYERVLLQTNQIIAGPAVIVEEETTIILPSNSRAIRQADGCIDILIMH